MKRWWQSKTVILNGLTAASAVLATLAGQQIIADNPRLAAGVAAGIAVVNIGLRFVTVLPIE